MLIGSTSSRSRTSSRRRVARVRTGDDAELGKGKSLLDATPTWLLGPVLRLGTWLTADRNVDLKRFGLPRQAFGSAMVSSVGTFGVHHAYGPLSPLYRVPVLALVGEIEPKPVVVDGEIVARPMLTVSATMDHRYLDGSHAARLGKSVRAYLENPAAFEPPLRHRPSRPRGACAPHEHGPPMAEPLRRGPADARLPPGDHGRRRDGDRATDARGDRVRLPGHDGNLP